MHCKVMCVGLVEKSLTKAFEHGKLFEILNQENRKGSTALDYATFRRDNTAVLTILIPASHEQKLLSNMLIEALNKQPVFAQPILPLLSDEQLTKIELDCKKSNQAIKAIEIKLEQNKKRDAQAVAEREKQA